MEEGKEELWKDILSIVYMAGTAILNSVFDVLYRDILVSSYNRLENDGRILIKKPEFIRGSRLMD
jgi:hypothetical protein